MKMMDYLNKISEVNANNLKMKFNYVFEAFDELMERYSVINENEEDQETVETDMTANIRPKIVSHFISSINEVRKNFISKIIMIMKYSPLTKIILTFSSRHPT